MEQICPLRQAISLGGDYGKPILGCLGMNHHYGSADYAAEEISRNALISYWKFSVSASMG
jgi:hypothetical protein